MVKEKILYEIPYLEITNFSDSDVISTSTPNWDNGNIDSDGWT